MSRLSRLSSTIRMRRGLRLEVGGAPCCPAATVIWCSAAVARLPGPSPRGRRAGGGALGRAARVQRPRPLRDLAGAAAAAVGTVVDVPAGLEALPREAPAAPPGGPRVPEGLAGRRVEHPHRG